MPRYVAISIPVEVYKYNEMGIKADGKDIILICITSYPNLNPDLMLNNDSYLYNLLNVLKTIGMLYKLNADLSAKIWAVIINMHNSHVYSKVGVTF